MNGKLIYRYGIAGWLALVVVAWAPAAFAKWANPQLLLTPEQLQKNIEKSDWVVVDCRDLDAYLKGHIPGAVSLGKKCGTALRDPTARVFKDVKKYEDLLGKVGVGNNTHVVFYHGDMRDLTDATVGFWVMEYLGHDGKVHVLNGGLDAWRKAGQRLDDKPAKKDPTTFKAKVVKSRYASTDEILKIAKGQVKGVQLIDSRTVKEHKGEDIRALRGGHIAAANHANIPYEQGWVDPAATSKLAEKKVDNRNGMALKDTSGLKDLYKGLDPKKEVVAYCQTGTRSTQTYAVLRELGFQKVRNYDDSWIVYGSNLDLPAKNASYYDFVKVNAALKRLEALEKRLDQIAPMKK